jgi:hypothetical protein
MDRSRQAWVRARGGATVPDGRQAQGKVEIGNPEGAELPVESQGQNWEGEKRDWKKQALRHNPLG